MNGHGEKRSRKEEAAISALLTESGIAAAAKKAGVAESTLRRWLQDNDFAKRCRLARRQVLEQATALLQSAAMDAVKALRAIVSSEDSPPSTRVAAARTILDMAYRAVEVDELSERLHRLEMTTEQMEL